VAVLVCAALLNAPCAPAQDISFRSFSGWATIGPPADEYAAKLANMSATTLGKQGQIRFAKATPTPPIPKEFKNIVDAVSAGGPLAGGTGFDAAYVSGGDLNAAWGFIYNSGVPFGPNFDEFIGFLYGKSVDNGGRTGLELLQQILDNSGRNIVAFPIVASSQQGSGYFMLPVGNVGKKLGIGLAGLCQQNWTFRYLPPAQFVIDRACDNLVEKGAIPKKNIKFIQAVSGNASLVKAVSEGQLQAYEMATPMDDYTQLCGLPEGNPGTVGTRYMHFPGWHQPFLLTYMIVNKKVWKQWTPAQQALALSVGRDNVVSSYGENLRQQGTMLQQMLAVNDHDNNPDNDMVLVQWPEKDLLLLRDATIQFLNARTTDAKLNDQDRKDYAKILDSLGTYIGANSGYWKVRQVPNELRFQGWRDPEGKKGWDQALK
jgi:TRAP-type mannitol/chloroaromatic compound transport system substrate-binding protein